MRKLFLLLIFFALSFNLVGQETVKKGVIRKIEKEYKSNFKKAKKTGWDVVIPPDEAPEVVEIYSMDAEIHNWGELALLPEAVRARIRKECTGRGVFKIFDTGADLDHTYLQKGKRPGSNYSGSPNLLDYHGHSTHVTGIIAGRGFGIAWDLIDLGLWEYEAVKYLDDSGRGTWPGLANAIQTEDIENEELVGLGLDVVINGSFSGGSSKNQAIEEALRASRGRGVYYCFSAGNDNGDVNYPANSEYGMAIGSLNSNFTRSSFSSYGPELWLAKPGGSIKSTYKDQTFADKSGTSMAAPFATGISAIALSRWPGKFKGDQAKLQNYLGALASDLGDPDRDDYYGWGVNYILSILDNDPDTISDPIPPEICDNGYDDDKDGLVDCDDPDCLESDYCLGLPPSKEERVITFDFDNPLSIRWRANNETVLKSFYFSIKAEVTTKYWSDVAYTRTRDLLVNHFANRSYSIIQDGDAYDMAYYVALFFHIIEDDSGVRIVEVDGRDEYGNPVKRLKADLQRRASQAAMIKSGEISTTKN